MLEACVEVGLLLERADVLEVGVVDVCVHPEQALEDGADDLLEAGREGLPIVLWEDARVVHLQQHSLQLGGLGRGRDSGLHAWGLPSEV